METKYFKEKRDIDYLPDDPFKAIRGSWWNYDPEDILAQMDGWLRIALSHQTSIYCDVKERARFLEFYDDLLRFIEASYIYTDKNLPKAHHPAKPRNPPYHRKYLNDEEALDSLRIIMTFFKQFPLLYIRIELWHFLQSVESYDGPLKRKINPFDLSSVHMHILTLVEGFNLLVSLKN